MGQGASASDKQSTEGDETTDQKSEFASASSPIIAVGNQRTRHNNAGSQRAPGRDATSIMAGLKRDFARIQSGLQKRGIDVQQVYQVAECMGKCSTRLAPRLGSAIIGGS